VLSSATSRVATADLTLSDRSGGVAVEAQLGGGDDSSGLTPGGTLTSNLGAFNIQINPGATLAGNAAALAAFERAAVQWESYISDPVTVVINADLASLGAGIIGSTNNVFLQGSYPTIRNRMVLDAGDEADDGIVITLPASPSFFLPPGFGLRGANPLFVNQAIVLTKANAKALGFTGIDNIGGPQDATITFSTNFSFDFDRSNGIGAGLLDFETVAAHEIGHTLGFTSEVDFVDTVLGQNGTSQDVQPMPLDFFRFDNGTANDPETSAQFATFTRSLVTNNVAIFDQIVGSFGGAPEVLMSTGFFTGDGHQASHWKNDQITGTLLGIMDPTLASGQIFTISSNDLRALDLIGYDLTAIPEAGALFFGGAATLLTGVGVAVRRRWKGGA
jgi:hypothetical protein